MKGTFWKIDGVVTNPNLPYLNEISMTYVKTTTGVSKMQLALQVNLTKNFVIFVGSTEGEFFSNEAATLSLGNSITYTVGANGGQKVIYFKAYKNGTIRMLGGEQITSLGLENGTDWSPANLFLSNTDNAQIVNFNLSQLSICTNIKNINILNAESFGKLSELKDLSKLQLLTISKGASNFVGSISELNNLPLTSLYIKGLDSFDFRYIPTRIVNLRVIEATSLINTGTDVIPALNGNIKTFSVNATNKLSAIETDKFLKSISTSLPNITAIGNTVLTISGQRTADSDAAVNTLVAKNFTVNLN